MERIRLERSIGYLYMYEGKFDEAANWIEGVVRAPETPAAIRADLTAVLGIIALRRGEIENCLECVGPSSCIFPIAREAVHTQPGGLARGGPVVHRLPGGLARRPPRPLAAEPRLHDAGRVSREGPAEYLIPLELFRSKVDVGRFENVATLVGLGVRGPNLAGGSIFDDFNGDGLPDLFTTSLDADLGASLFVNRGDGTFEDRSAAAGLGDQVYALNVTRADYDNDGDLDVLLLRGGWENPLRLSLLRNKGDGVFDDVTVASRPGRADRVRIGRLGRLRQRRPARPVRLRRVSRRLRRRLGVPGPIPRNRCRLYRNRGDGTFVDVAAEAGVVNERCAKGSAWGDYDGDGRLDLFVSNMRQAAAALPQRGGRQASATSPPSSASPGPLAQLRLLVLGLRQRRPARPLRQRLPGQELRGDRRAAWG